MIRQRMEVPLDEPLLDAEAEDDEARGAAARARANVRAVLWFSFVWSLARGIWQGQLRTVYLAKQVSGSMTNIGIIEGVQGLARLASAVGAGVVSDRLRGRRNLLLYGSAAFGVGVHAACALLVVTPALDRLGPWLAGLSLYAVLVSLQTVVVESLLADSTASGARVRDYTHKRLCQQLGLIAGPALQLAMLRGGAARDAWSARTTRALILVGAAIGAGACALQLAMDQRRTLDHASEARQLQGGADAAAAPGDAGGEGGEGGPAKARAAAPPAVSERAARRVRARDPRVARCACSRAASPSSSSACTSCRSTTCRRRCSSRSRSPRRPRCSRSRTRPAGCAAGARASACASRCCC